MSIELLDMTKTPSQLFSSRLERIAFTQQIIKDLDNLDNIKKKQLKTDFLLDSYILNLVANWQVFIEELLEYGLHEILKKTSDDNIKKVLSNNYYDSVKRFNSPNTENIDLIFMKVLGIIKITNCLESQLENKLKINNTLKIRHQIAHKGCSTEVLNYEANFEIMQFFFDCAKKLEQVVKDKIRE